MGNRKKHIGRPRLPDTISDADAGRMFAAIQTNDSTITDAGYKAAYLNVRHKRAVVAKYRHHEPRLFAVLMAKVKLGVT